MKTEIKHRQAPWNRFFKASSVGIIFLIISALLLGGCGYIEPEARYTVTAIGCMQTQKGFTLTVSLTDVNNRSEEAKGSGFLVEGEGETIASALNDIRSKLSKKPSFSHCRIITVTDRTDKESLRELLDLCIELDVSLNCPIACCNRIKNLFSSDALPTGGDLASLIKENAEHFGYGGHTALFEIKTALLVEESKFALPILEVVNEQVAVKGLYYFTSGSGNYHLNYSSGINCLCGLSAAGRL